MATQSDLVSFVTQVTCPDDFDQFWDGALAELAAIPLDASLAADPLRSTDAVKVYPGRLPQPGRAGYIRVVQRAGRGRRAVSSHPAPARLQVGADPAAGLGRPKGVAVYCRWPCAASCPAVHSFQSGVSRPAHPRR